MTIHKIIKKKKENARRANLIRDQTLYALETITTKGEWIRKLITQPRQKDKLNVQPTKFSSYTSI